METHPGKHLFIDDFFIESMQGTRRVLNHPQKLTVDAPREIPMDRAWEAGSPRFQRVIYIEEVGRFRLYYTSWPNGLALVCALESPVGPAPPFGRRASRLRPTISLLQQRA